MDHSKLTIGQMAELNHVSTQTLRYYDKLGILKPYLCDESTGYRYYSMAQCAVLDIITHMKSLNMSLEQIKNYIETGEKNSFISELLNKYEKNKEELKRLENIQAVLEQKIRDYQKCSLMPPDGIPYLEVLPQRTIYKFDTHINYYYNENSSSTYEYMLRLFKNNLLENHIGSEYFYNVGSIMHKNNFISGRFVSTELIIFLDKEHKFSQYELIPAGVYLCMTCENTEREIDYISLLLKEIEHKHYIINGDYICEVVKEFFSFDSQKRNMTLKLQVPIRFQ